jgi:microcystin-dependent protein
VIGPSGGGGGGGGTVDPTTIFQTGDVKSRYGTGVLTGWVRMNGRTIGSATSGATERANSDCQSLFEYLWNSDPNLSVATGRGASATADWVANKTIALPDARGRVLASLDDMGNSAAGRLTTALSGVDGLTLGSSGGTQNQSVARAQLPNVTLSYSNSISVTSTENNISHGVAFSFQNGGGITLSAGGGIGSSSVTSTGTSSGNTASINGGVSQTGLIMLPPTITVTNYQKL